MMDTREQALAELAGVFEMISTEYRDQGQSLPADTTEILHAWRNRARISANCHKTCICVPANHR